MNFRVIIPVLAAILILLLASIPLLSLNNQTPGATEPVISNPDPTEPLQVAPDSQQQSTEPMPGVPDTQPPTAEPTQPETVPPTQAPLIMYSDIPEINDFMNQRLTQWICPLKDPYGAITGDRVFASSRSNGNRAHAGIDFVAPHGTTIFAITSGTVQRVAVFYQGTYSVEILNDDGSILRYCEIATNLNVGEYVRQGDIIGTIKRATGGTEMLHMEVYYGNVDGPLTQTWNTAYLYVDSSKSFVRRSDLLDPTFLKDLPVSS